MPHRESTSYGESRLRLLRVLRHGDRDDPRDVTVGLRFDGPAETMVPGEAVKNLVHRVARGQAHPAVEDLGLAIAARVLEQYPSIDGGRKPQGRAFTPSGGERRTALVTADRARARITSGIADLSLLRTSGFAPPPGRRDIASDGLHPLFVASLAAQWTYASNEEIPYALYREGLRGAIIETFARADARSP